MALPVKLLAKAQADLRQLYQYISAHSPESAQKCITELRKAIVGLGDFPLAGPHPRDERLKKKGYRFLPRGEYLIFYKIGREQVTDYRILHGKRQYGALL